MLEWKVDKYGIHKHFPRFSSHLICHTFRHYLREYNTYVFSVLYHGICYSVSEMETRWNLILITKCKGVCLKLCSLSLSFHNCFRVTES
jgi:hypothetical protein